MSGSWDQEKYIKAWRFASVVHNGQMVPGSDFPYIHHVGLVAMEVAAAIVKEDIDYPDLAIQCALLHDTIEDTATSYEELVRTFGEDVASGVLALSKDKDTPSEYRMNDSLNRIKAQPREVGLVKLADRITNLQPPPTYWNSEKISTYKAEAELILKELGSCNLYLRNRLQKKINSYPAGQ